MGGAFYYITIILTIPQCGARAMAEVYKIPWATEGENDNLRRTLTFPEDQGTKIGARVSG